MTQCPQCGAAYRTPPIPMTPFLALRLALFAFGVICWGIILLTGLPFMGLRGAPIFGTPPPSGLLALPLVQIVIAVGAGIGFWEGVAMLRGSKKRCAACGHTW